MMLVHVWYHDDDECDINGEYDVCVWCSFVNLLERFYGGVHCVMYWCRGSKMGNDSNILNNHPISRREGWVCRGE